MIDERAGVRVRMVGDTMVLDHVGGGCAPAGLIERRLVERIAELEAALRYYASDHAWTVDQVEGPNGDYGNRARAALGDATQ